MWHISSHNQGCATPWKQVSGGLFMFRIQNKTAHSLPGGFRCSCIVARAGLYIRLIRTGMIERMRCTCIDGKFEGTGPFRMRLCIFDACLFVDVPIVTAQKSDSFDFHVPLSLAAPIKQERSVDCSLIIRFGILLHAQRWPTFAELLHESPCRYSAV